MTTIYIAHPKLRLIPELSLARIEGKVFPLAPDELKILLRPRIPILKRELNRYRTSFIQSCFLPIDVSNPDALIRIDCALKRTTKKNATFLRILAKSTVTLFWPQKKISLKEGEYLLPGVFPEKIEGAYRTSWLLEESLETVRDNWIIDQVKKASPSQVLELGSGKNPRLARKIKAELPTISYQGMDKLKSDKALNIVRGNFLSRLPRMKKGHLVIMEEVAEHLPPQRLNTLIATLLKNGASRILITTPNREFNRFIGRTIRRDDHEFEWDRGDLRKWLRELSEQHKTHCRYKGLGRQIEKVYPTWAVIINRS